MFHDDFLLYFYSRFLLRKHTKTVGGSARVGGTKALGKCSRKSSRKSFLSRMTMEFNKAANNANSN